MPQIATIIKDATPDEWADRGDYWLKRLNPVSQYKARKRRIIHRPLVLSGHGIRLSVDCGTLLIKCGFTHYPQKREEYRFFPQDRQLPSRIVILDGDGSITFDALEWMSLQKVPLVQINWRGEVTGVGGANYSANSEFVQHQLAIKNNTQGFEFSKWLILKKIENSYETIKYISNNSEDGKSICEKIKIQEKILKENPPKDLSSLLAIEGVTAAAYFRYWYTLPIKWKGIGRKPIPQEWQQIGSRIAGSKRNQFARHPVNAILNYAYGVLENQVRAQLLAAGIDPTIGYIHALEDNRPSLVFDLMEPLRPVMDRYILEFILNRIFSPDDFILNKTNGVCRLHPQLARYVVKSLQDIPEIEIMTKTSLKTLFLTHNKPRKLVNTPKLKLVTK